MTKKLLQSNSEANIRAMARHFGWSLVYYCEDVG